GRVEKGWKLGVCPGLAVERLGGYPPAAMSKFQTLVDIYTDAIKTFPDNPLFGTKKAGSWQWMTYLEFGKLTDGFRSGLASLGLAKGDRVAIIADNRAEWA